MSESHDASANPLSADAEDIRVARLDDVSVTEALDGIMAPLGSLARFIHPAALNLPPEVTANTDGVDPRDIARFFREVPERPRVLIDLGAEPCTTALLDEVLRRARALGTEISVATTHVSDRVSSCCARHDARLTSATDPIEYDFAIALRRLSARPFCPAVEHASFELWLYDSARSRSAGHHCL